MSEPDSEVPKKCARVALVAEVRKEYPLFVYQTTEMGTICGVLRSHRGDFPTWAKRATVPGGYPLFAANNFAASGPSINLHRAITPAILPITERLPDERRPDAHLTRDIFGSPFRPVTLDPSWRTTTAIVLAQQMYESGDFSAMPILADAL